MSLLLIAHTKLLEGYSDRVESSEMGLMVLFLGLGDDQLIEDRDAPVHNNNFMMIIINTISNTRHSGFNIFIGMEYRSGHSISLTMVNND